MVRFWRSTKLVEILNLSGSPADYPTFGPGKLVRAIPSRAVRSIAVLLNQHGVVDIPLERPFHGIQIDRMAVRG